MFTRQAKDAFLTFAIREADETILLALDEALRAAPDAPPSRTVGPLLEWLFTDGVLPESCRADFLYAIDTMHTWLFLRDMSSPTNRRSRHLRERARRIRCIAFNFANDSQLDRPVCDILADPETRYHRREDLTAPRVPLALRYRLAAAIDRGEEPIIRRTEELLATCRDNRADHLIIASLRSRNERLHEAVARRVSHPQIMWDAEWLGWCDLGTREGLIAVFRALDACGTINNHPDLWPEAVPEAIEKLTKLFSARFSSPIPANQHHLLNRHGNGATLKAVAHIRDYITQDTVHTALRCLTEPAFRDDCLRSDSGMDVHLGLWALGTECDQAALDMVDALIESGTPLQRLAACLFLQQGRLTWAASRYDSAQDMGRWLNKAIRLHPEEKELLAVCLPAAVVQTADPDALSWWFADESEARAAFETCMSLAQSLEKKETFEGCGYPWLKVHLTRSDAARNACCLARLLQDDDLIDRACGVLKQIHSDYRYGATVFLTRACRTDVQRQAFFGLICDRDRYIRAIHRHKVTTSYRPTPADAPLLESLLAAKYDDAREELLRLLLLLPEDALQASIQRLLASKKAALHTAGQELSTRASNIQKNPQ